MSTRCLLNICWVFRERCGGTKAYSCLQVSLRQILKLLILWAQKTADRELTAYVSGFEEEIITDMVMDWLDILSSAFSLPSPSASTVSRDSSFMGEAGKIRKLVLREGRWLAQGHTACTSGFRLEVCYGVSYARTLSTTFFIICSKSYGSSLPCTHCFGLSISGSCYWECNRDRAQVNSWGWREVAQT